MNIEDLKKFIEDKTITNNSILFKYKDVDFVANQYVDEICNILNLNKEYIDDLSMFNNKNDIFGSPVDLSKAYVYICDECDDLPNDTNLYVICKKSKYRDCVEIPKLEDWQIKDYVYSIAKGVEEKDLNFLLELCKNNIYLIESELDKIKLYAEGERKYAFKSFIEEGMFSQLTNKNIFDFSTLILNHKLQDLVPLYKQLYEVDVEPLALVTILYENFRNIITCCLQKNPTERNTGLSGKRIWATKKYAPKGWSKEDVVKAFEFMCMLQSMLVSGELPENLLVDWIVIHLANVSCIGG